MIRLKLVSVKDKEHRELLEQQKDMVSQLKSQLVEQAAEKAGNFV